MLNRRQLLGAGAAGATLVSSKAWGQTLNMGLPEAAQMDSAATAITARPNSGPDYTPVVTLNGWTLPHRMNNGVKEFHLVAEPVERELADGMIAHLWGYNGQSTGPTIEAVEGDRVRIYVTNKLPEGTTVHWHGLILPSGMDGVSGLSHPSIPPGKTFVYEFDLVRHRKVPNPYSHQVALVHDQRIDVGEDPAVPGPKVEIRHRHDAGYVGARINIKSVQHDQEVPIDAHEIGILWVDHEHAHHAHCHLHHLIPMGVIHEGAGFGQIELIDKSLARRDAGVAEAADTVHARGQDQPVPMHRRMLGQAVGDIDAHPVAFDRLNGGAGWRLGQRAVHDGGFRQAHVHGLAPCFGGNKRGPSRAGP